MTKEIARLKKINKRKLLLRLNKKPKVKKRKPNDNYVVIQQDNRGVVGVDEVKNGVASPGDTVTFHAGM